MRRTLLGFAMLNLATYPSDDWISLSQAAVAAESSVREMNRIIDERLLPDTMARGQPSRALSLLGCAMARFYFKTAPSLTKEERLKAIKAVSSNMSNASGRSLVVQADWLTIDFTTFLRDTQNALKSLADLKTSIISDPEILAGEHVFAGTRIPVYMIAEALAQGDRAADIFKAYPGLNEQLVSIAEKFADAYPRKGRPASRVDSRTQSVSQKTIRMKKNA